MDGFDTESEAEEFDFVCVCNHDRAICTCMFEAGWMQFTLIRLTMVAFSNGEEQGVQDGIRDTIYQIPCNQHNYQCPEELPEIADIDPYRYRHQYLLGHVTGYHKVYRRHQVLLDQLRMIHAFRWMKIYVLNRFRKHALLDLCLFQKIENYIPWDS